MVKQRNAVCAALLLTTAAVTLLTPSRALCELRCEKPAVNAGVVCTGTRLLQHFELCNWGEGLVEIGDIKPSCGCLSPRLSRRILKPHETATVELEINTLSQAAGPNTWTVRVRYHDGGVANEITLQLSAQLESEIVVEPAAMVLLADKIAGHEVAITDSRAKPFTLTAARASSDKIKPRILGPDRDKEGHRTYHIAMSVSDSFPEGRHDDVLEIRTDDPKYSELRIPVTIIKRAQKRLIATPNEANVTAAAGLPVPSRIVLIRDTGQGRVKIAEVTSDDAAIACTWAEGPKMMATLKIRVNHALIPGHTLSSAVHVRISSPVQETLTIPVNCAIR